MNPFLILILSIIFTFIGENLLKEPIFPLKETGMQNFLIFCLVVLAVSLVGIIFFVRREYRGVKKSGLKFFPFVKQVLIKNKSFLRGNVGEKRPPFLILTLFLAGASGVVSILNGAHYLYYGGVSSWFSVWTLVVIFGLFHGYIRYVIVGFLYQIGVWLSGGGFKGQLASRNIAHYALFPLFLTSVALKIIEMFVYGDAYFVAPTFQWLNIVTLMAVLLAGLYSFFLLFRSSLDLKKVKKGRGIFFFMIVPFLILFILRGPAFGEAFDSLTKSLDYNNQGIMYMNNGDLDAAEQSFLKAIESMDSKNKDEMVTAHINLATIYQNKGDVESAKESYKKALPYLSKTDAQYFGIQGILKLFDGDVTGAIDFFDQAIKADSQNYTANNYLGLIYMGQMGKEFVNPEKALVYNLHIYEKDSSGSSGLQNLALNYYQLGRFAEAMPLFEELLPMMPDNPLVQLFLGLTYYRLGYISDAVLMLGSATDMAPELLSEEVQAILNESEAL